MQSARHCGNTDAKLACNILHRQSLYFVHRANENRYINNKLYFITGDDIEYLLAYLNSKAFNKVILASANLTGGKGVDFMEKVFAPADYELKRRILSSMEERERDEIFNGFFGFTDEETAFLSC